MKKPNEVEEERCQQSQLVTKTLAQEEHRHLTCLPVVQKPARWILAESHDLT